MTWADNVFANTLFVEDALVTRAFYAKVFETEPIFEDENSVVFKFGELLINLLSQEEAPDLIGPWAVASKTSGARFQLTIRVTDVDAQTERLLKLGVPIINGPIDRTWGVRTALFADPDGHLWELAQELESTE